MSDFTVVDRRGMRRSAASSNFYVGDPNTEMRRLRQAGYTLPKSPVQARIEAKRVADTATRTSLTEATNRSIMSEMRRNRMASGMRRTGSNVQMAMPKVREPFASLEDRGIPYDTQDLRDLSTIRRWCRLWYTTHDLVPLLIDIYSKFPVVGLEFRSTDKKIQEFYEQMFMDDLNYGEFLSEGLGREFFTVGEVTSLAHFNESLGIWSSEEVLNPEMIRVSKSLFVQQERIQLMVKELVENLRSGPSGGGDAEETPSERLERTHEYCCTPKTKVLTADLQWVPVDSLKVGDPIMGFDEYPRPGKGNKRQWVPTRVTATKSIAGNTYRVVTDGPSVECTDQHRWLAVPQNRNETLPIDTTQDEEFYPTYDWRGKEIARSKPWILRPCNHCGIPMELRPSAAAVTKFCSKRCSNSVKNRQYSSGLNSGQLMWVRTDELRPGDKIMHLGLWDVEDNRDTGWMGGFLDGEGTLGKTGITFSQNVGPVLDRALSILGQYKFDYSYHELAPHQKSGKVCARVRIKGGQSELLRALSIFRPVRLLERLADWINGAQIAGDWVTVTEVTHLGSQEVIALATSSKTLIAEGMFSHNTQLLKHYPEIIKAAAQDDGLDISDALVSRLVNKAAPWDLRGTPHLLRSFRTLMMEESLNQAQNAVCDRLYAPLILATMGIENMGDGEPWIPDQGELDDLRDDMQNALAADFKLLVHNFGVNVQSVFGRESVPRFDSDYDRIDAKLLQAWGIGQALIAGGSGAGGAYASSALNREVCEQLMLTFQKKVLRHMRKRAEVIAEAQEHYDYELKGGVRVPIYREIVQFNEETGEDEIVRVPKLLIPEIEFACVVPETQVLTPTGMKAMGDLVAGDPVIAWDEDEEQYVHDFVRSTGPRPPEPTVTVTVHSGKSVTCTRDHPFVTQRGWVTAAALKTSDLIRTSTGAMLPPMIQARWTPNSLNVASVLGEGVEVVNNDIVRLSRGGAFCSPFPAVLPTSDETWELLGHYVARGSSSRGTTVRWYTKDTEVRTRIKHLITSVFGDVKINQNSGGIAVYSRPLACWLTALFDGESPSSLDQIRLLDVSAARIFLDAVTAREPVLAHATPAVHRALHEMALSTGYKNDGLVSDDDIARFLGLLVGDGNYSTTHVALETMDQEVIDFTQSIGGRLGLQTAVRAQDGSKSSKVTFSRPHQGPRTVERNVLHSLLRGEEMWGHDGHHKRVPSFVWSRGAEVRAAFLSGYLDADGSVIQAKETGQITIVWSSVNRALLDDCQVLLESLGIRSTVRTYQVPLGVKLPQGGSPGRIGDYSHLTVGHRIDRKLCQQVLTPLISRKAERLGTPVSERTHVHVRDVCWDQVVSVIDAGQKETVALEVAINHSHITSGLGTSNTLNLRDEAQERQFIAQLKEMGVPVSDGTLAVNIPIKFREELEKQAEETVSKGLAKAQAMKKLQAECDAQGLPYPDDLVASLSATLQLRQGLAQTEMVEGQADMQEQQIKQMQAPAAASMGLIPGLAPPPPPEEGQQKTAASGPDADGPTASGPGGVEHGGEEVGLVELPRNRQRPVESDEQRASMPKRLSRGPSSYGQAKKVPLNRVERAIRRRASGVTVDDLVHDPETYAITNMEAYESQIVADWPEILAGGAPDSRKLLEELLEQYEEVMGVQPRW